MTQTLTTYWKRYSDYLQALVRERRVRELKDALRQLRDVAIEWSAIAPELPLGGRRRYFGYREPGVDGPLGDHVADGIRSAIQSSDEGCIEAFASFLSQLAIHATSHHLPGVVYEVGSLAQFMYYQLAERGLAPDLRNAEWDKIVYYLIWYSTAALDHPAEGKSRDLQARMSSVRQSVRAVVGFVRTAIRFDLDLDGERFAIRLFEREKHRDYFESHAPTVESLNTLFDYAKMIIAGWSITWLENHPGNAAAKTVLRKIPAAKLGRATLIGVWELYNSPESRRNAIDTELGVEHLDPTEPEERRPGVGEMRSVDMHWIHRGLHWLLLHARARRTGEDYFSEPPPRRTWSEKTSREWLERVAAIPEVGIEEEERQATVDTVCALIREREIASEVAYLVRAIESPIDAEIRNQFDESVKQQAMKERHWEDAIRSVATSPSAATFTPIRARAGMWMWRDFFVPGNSWIDGFSSHLGSSIARRDAIRLFSAADASCPTGEPITALATVRKHLQSAAQTLRTRGFEPSIVVVPEPPRFACAVLERPLWQARTESDFGDATVGKWDGMLVLYWPYTDATSIMVADAGALFGNHESDRSGEITIVVNDFTEEKRQNAIDALRQCVEENKMPEDDVTNILVEAYSVPRYGIADQNAGMTLSVEKSDASFAMSTLDNFYHRVDCEEIEGDDDLWISLEKRRNGETEDRNPCPKCEPEKMDFEARMRNT